MAGDLGLKQLMPWNIALNAGKSVFGIFQAAKASRDLRNLKRPTYETPESLTQMGSYARQLAGATEMPGQRQYEEKLGQTQAEGVSNAMKFATSSLAGQNTAENLAAKKMQAIQDLGGMFAEYKAKRQQDLMGVMGQEAEDQRMKWDINQFQPYQIKMNELTDKRQMGWSNMFGGIDSGMAAMNNLAGTQDYSRLLQSMHPKMGDLGKDKSTEDADPFNPFANWKSPTFKMPKYNYNPYQNG